MVFPNLAVVSPHTKGPAVKDAQWLLSGYGRFGEKYYTDAMDGEYGPLTAAGAYRAKYWLGYPLSECDHVFGAKLHSYLLPLSTSGAKALPLTYRARRAARQHVAVTKGAKALAYAKQFIGYREGSNNDNEFGAFFNINHNPWCGCFVSYCYTKTGTHIFLPYVPNIVAWANAGSAGLYRVSQPRGGDLVCFDWTGDGVYDHVEFVESVDGQGNIHTLGGNTLPPNGSGDASNGGGVYENARSGSTHHVFVRVK